VPRSAKLALSDFLFEFLTLGLVESRHTAFVVQFVADNSVRLKTWLKYSTKRLTVSASAN
jgi:hypothetical protein